MKCRTDYFVDGDTVSDEIGIAVAHMHSECASKRNTNERAFYKAFWDKLAQGILMCYSRVLCMDASTALWCVVPELRARGFMVSMAGFCPFYEHMDQHAKVDSLGIFVIGPANGIRMAFCPATVDFPLHRTEALRTNWP